MIAFIRDPGVLGVIFSETSLGAYAFWYEDGIQYNTFLEKEEYTLLQEYDEEED